METVKKIDKFLGTMEHQLNVTVFAIMMGWFTGFIMPTFFMVVK